MSLEEKVAKKFTDVIFSTESMESKDKLLQAIVSGDWHPYWMNWGDISDMLACVSSEKDKEHELACAHCEENQRLKDKISTYKKLFHQGKNGDLITKASRYDKIEKLIKTLNDVYINHCYGDSAKFWEYVDTILKLGEVE